MTTQQKLALDLTEPSGSFIWCKKCHFVFEDLNTKPLREGFTTTVMRHQEVCPGNMEDPFLQDATKTNPRQDILDEASKCVNIDRTQNYGPPEQGFKNIAEIWSVILGTPITSAQVAQCMVGLKLARLIQSPGHKDSWVDIAGYAACGWEASQ